MSDDRFLQLVEVKSVGDFGFVEVRLGSSQKRRLVNVSAFFLQHYPEVELYLAIVDSRNNVQIFDEF
jgi:hypothetical protein